MELKFKDCTLEKLEDMFGLKEVRQTQALSEWLNNQVGISDFERQVIEFLQQQLIDHVSHWNEDELAFKFIGPLMTLVNYTDEKFDLFTQRPLEGQIDDIKLNGKPDGIIASGKRSPRKPYFCFQEYKRENDPTGEPAGQVLGAMLVAQELNEHQHPIYGCYVRGKYWTFMVLEGKEYSRSLGDVATRDDVFTIFKVLKGLKPILHALIP